MYENRPNENLMIKISTTLKNELAAYCEREETTMSAAVRSAIRKLVMGDGRTKNEKECE